MQALSILDMHNFMICTSLYELMVPILVSLLLALKKVRATCQNVGTKRKLPHSRTWFVNATVGVVGGYTQPRVAYDADCGWVLVPSSCRFMLSLTCNVYDLVCDDQL